MSPSKIYPSTLLRLMDTANLRPQFRPSVDTETSGLWTDAGARISTVSVAFIVPQEDLAEWSRVLGGGEQYIWDDGIWTLRKETTAMARASAWSRGGWVEEDWVLSFAWPFDQGSVGTGKPEDPTDRIRAHGMGGLLADLEGIWEPDAPVAEPNLDLHEWCSLLRWLKDVGRKLGLDMHNAKFDVHQFAAGVRRWTGGEKRGVAIDLLPYVVWDTQSGADLWTGWRMSEVTGRSSTSLKPTGQWLWGDGEADEKEVISKYLKQNKLPAGRWDLMPWRVIAKYADQDARLTARLSKWQQVEQSRVRGALKLDGVPEKGWTAGGDEKVFERRMEVMRMLTRVERRGVPFNEGMAREASVELEQRSAAVEAKLAEVLGGQVTLPVAKHYWFGNGDKSVNGGVLNLRGLGHRPYAVTDKGDPVVDQATLAKMLRDGLPMVEEWMAYKKLEDARSRWYDGWADRAGPDGRLRPGFRQNGTASGRFSVENVQLQAIPADYKVRGILEGIPSPRDLIGAGVPEGYELWEMDLAQAELRVAAWMAGCQKMLQLIDEGADLHGETARELFGVSPEDADWGMYRQVAKRGNFSLIFGVGWETFAATLWKEAGIEWDEQQTRSFITAWNRLYPEFKAAIDKHDAVVMARYAKYGVGWLDIGKEQGLNERRWFTKFDIEYFNQKTGRKEEGAHKAFNQRVQPTLAQYGIDRWLAEDRWLMERFADDPLAGLVLMVHDSSVLLLPTGTGPEVTGELARMGEDLWADWFPGLPGGLDATAWAAHA